MKGGAETLTSGRVTLRAARPGDMADRLAYGRDPEYRRMVGGDPNNCPPLTEAEVARWYDSIKEEPLHWAIEVDGRCIGSAFLHEMDTENRRARYGIGIFDRARWGAGLGTEATRLVLGYAFDVLRLHRVDLRVFDFNLRAIACYEKCGFVREGVERDSALVGGEWRSDVMMSILEPEYRRL